MRGSNILAPLPQLGQLCRAFLAPDLYMVSVEALLELSQLSFFLPSEHSLINTLHVNLHLRTYFPENPIYGTVLLVCKIYKYKAKNELSLKSIFTLRIRT